MLGHAVGGGTELGEGGDHLIRLAGVFPQDPSGLTGLLIELRQLTGDEVGGIGHLHHHLLQVGDETVHRQGDVVQLVMALHLDAGGQVGIAGTEGIDVELEGLQPAAELADGQHHEHEQQPHQGQLDTGQGGEHVPAVLGQGAGRQCGGEQPGGAFNGLHQQGLLLPLILEGGAQQPLARVLAEQAGDGPGEGVVGVGGEVAEHHIAAEAGVLAQDLAVSLDDHHLATDLLLLPGHQIVEEPQGHVYGRYPVQGAVLVDPHGAVGPRLLTGAILVGCGPDAHAARSLLPRLVPGLLEVVRRLGRVPVGVGDEGVGRVPVIEGAELGAARLAFIRQGPDAATEDHGVAVLIDEGGQQGVYLLARQLGHQLGDAAGLALHPVELVADVGGYLADPQRHILLTGLLQRRLDPELDADHRQGAHQRHESHEDGGITPLDCAQIPSHNDSCPLLSGPCPILLFESPLLAISNIKRLLSLT